MTILGWAIIVLMVGAMIHTIRAWRGNEASTEKDFTLMTIIIGVNVMSALDAISTIFLIGHNQSSEMNPFMNALLERSYVLFFAAKFSLTMIATLVCWHYYGRKRRARTILKLTTRIYCALMAWHCLLLSSVLL